MWQGEINREEREWVSLPPLKWNNQAKWSCDWMEKLNIISKVDEPTDWVNQTVSFVKR